MAMTLNSPAFQQNGHIPSKYTCEGEDVSPPLAWEGVPNGAKSLVLIIDDPDAPDPKAPKMVWVHWVVYNIPPDTKSLPENAGKARMPQSALLGLNDFKKTGYGGPCPPIGNRDGLLGDRWPPELHRPFNERSSQKPQDHRE
jgi:Raf kinase inhibitor-like YbhB/YbcL family protein